ncbi:MAG: TRAP transporter substrate-binding protein [Actinobacteria bacterium]|nr:TRAP transporter substrate-binding protein [Actinomycetota bacterium]
MKKASWLVAVVLVISLVGLLAGCGETTTTTTAGPTTTAVEGETTTTEAEEAPGEPVELKFSFFAPEGTFPGKASLWFIEELEKATNGQVTVKWFPGGTLLTAQNTYDGVVEGVADIGLSCPTYEPGRFPLLSLNDMPRLYTTGTQGSLAVYDVTMANKDIAELKDFHVVTIFSMEPGYIMSIKEYTTLESLKGAEIRSPGGPKTLEALGAISVGMPQSEVAQALQTNVIAGIYTSREALEDFKYAEKCKYVLDYPLGQVTFLAVMTKDKYNSLPDNVKKAIDDLGRPFSEKGGEIIDTTAASGLEWAIAEEGVKVVTLSPEEEKKFDDALAPLRQGWLDDLEGKGLPAEDFFKQLQEAAAKYAQ